MAAVVTELIALGRMRLSLRSAAPKLVHMVKPGERDLVKNVMTIWDRNEEKIGSR